MSGTPKRDSVALSVLHHPVSPKRSFVSKSSREGYTEPSASSQYSASKDNIEGAIVSLSTTICLSLNLNANKVQDVAEPRCFLCDKVFLQYQGLNRHIDEKHGPQFRCATCQASFVTLWDYIRHIEGEHGGQYRCLLCKDVYFNYSNLHEHSLTIHEQPLQSWRSQQSTHSSGHYSSPRKRENEIFTERKPNSLWGSSSFNNHISQQVQGTVNRISLSVGNGFQSKSSSTQAPSMDSGHDSLYDFDETGSMLSPPTFTSKYLSVREDIGGKNQDAQCEAQHPKHLTEKNLQHMMQDGKSCLCQFKDCDRSFIGQGFRRRWVLHDHMKRVHGLDPADTGRLKPSSAGSISPNSGTGSISPSGMDSAGENTEASCQSRDSTESEILRMTVLHEKHMLLLSLMESFYDEMLVAYIYRTATAGSRSQQTSNSSQSTASGGQFSNASNPRRGHKRHKDEDDEPPEEHRSGKRGEKGEGVSSKHAGSRLFACPYHKYDPRTHCVNSLYGAKYRTCAGPGFKQLSHVR